MRIRIWLYDCPARKGLELLLLVMLLNLFLNELPQAGFWIRYVIILSIKYLLTGKDLIIFQSETIVTKYYLLLCLHKNKMDLTRL